MEAILKKDLYLTDFLNEINKAVPKGLWLTRLSFSSKGLVLEGSVFSFDSDEVSLANSFFDELKSDNFFVENFVNFNIGSVQRRNIKEYEIVDFLFTADKRQEKETPKGLPSEISHKRKR
jgi:Tfp pilus assembly protein PilN